MERPSNEQFDPQLDALLDEALSAEPAPSDLVDRIVAQTNEMGLGSMLDEALAPEAAPPDLVDRIVAQTSNERIESMLDEALAAEPASKQLVNRIVAKTADQFEEPVVARIGFFPSWARAAAAVIVLGAWTTMWMVGGGIVKDAQELAQVEFLEQSIEYELTVLADYAPSTIDEELAQLNDRIELVDNPIANVLDELEQINSESTDPLF
jgi:hypothetical protein